MSRHTITINSGDAEKVARYLPSNYAVTGADRDGCVIISGEDSAGWTLHDYVLPRLASGLIFPRSERED
jgi:hypothetical protein